MALRAQAAMEPGAARAVEMVVVLHGGGEGGGNALKWIAQHGVPLAVKADQVQYQQQDIDLFDFTLSDDDMAALDAATSPSATPGMFCRN